jgi:hypothetical protein
MRKATPDTGMRPAKRFSMFSSYKRILEVGVTVVFLAWLVLVARWLFGG